MIALNPEKVESIPMGTLVYVETENGWKGWGVRIPCPPNRELHPDQDPAKKIWAKWASTPEMAQESFKGDGITQFIYVLDCVVLEVNDCGLWHICAECYGDAPSDDYLCSECRNG